MLPEKGSAGAFCLQESIWVRLQDCHGAMNGARMVREVRLTLSIDVL